jgi:Na+/melibiose symporter-like transporter
MEIKVGETSPFSFIAPIPLAVTLFLFFPPEFLTAFAYGRYRLSKQEHEKIRQKLDDPESTPMK